MNRRSGGTKRSSWLTFRRRLLLVRLLLRGPTSRDELIAVVNQEMGEQGYPGDPSSALKHDLDALKAEYGCRITFHRRSRRYILDDLGELALLDLSDEQIEALRRLDASFPGGADAVEHAHIRAVIDRVLLLLPPYRQGEFRVRRALPGASPAPANPVGPSYHVRYRLAPAVARREQSALFPNAHTSYGDDGSATVSATVTNLLQAHQILLRYGDACKVLEPPALVELFRSTARGLAHTYLPEERAHGRS